MSTTSIEPTEEVRTARDTDTDSTWWKILHPTAGVWCLVASATTWRNGETTIRLYPDLNPMSDGISATVTDEAQAHALCVLHAAMMAKVAKANAR